MRQTVLCLPLLLSVACFDTAPDAAHLYAFSSIAPSLASQQSAVMNMQYPGATVIDRGVNFSVYSEHATRIDVLIFEDPEAALPTQEFQLTHMGNVWNGYVQGIGAGAYYGYVAWGPNWPEDPNWVPGTIYGFKADVDDQGNRFNPNKLLYDPYCQTIHRNYDWTKGPSCASGPTRAQSDYAEASKCVIIQGHQGTYQWSDNETTWRANRQLASNPGHNWNDLIVYETHVRGLTNDPASGVLHPGTYRGLGEFVPYFQDLGVTAVELMPIHSKPADGTYWGYNSLTFFSPEYTYAATPEPIYVMDEFKWMVDQLHQAGIEVILDVVYNHYGEGGLWENKIQYNDVNLGAISPDALSNFDPDEVASFYSFRGLDNAAYYALGAIGSCPGCGYWNNTGVGEESRANHTPVSRMIVDSLHYWVQEGHVDGFRFDLAPVLGEKDGDYNNWDTVQNTVLQKIVDDPILNQHHTRIIAEPWEAGGNDPYRVGQFPAATDQKANPGVRWYEWNGKFRDWWRPFENCPGVQNADGSAWNPGQCSNGWTLNTDVGSGVDGGGTLTGTAGLYQWNGRPYHAVNFVTVHDGFTMYDMFSYNKPVNGCGPLNPVCCSDPSSPWCDTTSGTTDNRSHDWGSDTAGEAMKRQLMRNLFTAMMVSHGTPLLLGGDEWMRTQLGNNNAYSDGANNSFNWYGWGEWLPKAENNRMHDFVRKVIAFRKSHEYAFAPTDWTGEAPLSWLSENGDGNVNWGGRHVQMYYSDASKGQLLDVIINGESQPVQFKLPPGTWRRIVDTQGYFDTDPFLQENAPDVTVSHNIDPKGTTQVTGSYGAAAQSMVVLVGPSAGGQ